MGNGLRLTLPERRRGIHQVRVMRTVLMACRDPEKLAMERSGKLEDDDGHQGT